MKNKQITNIAIIVTLILTIITGMYILNPTIRPEGVSVSPELTELEQSRVINANGEGRIKAIPDIAYVSVGVVVENEDLGEAQKEATDIMNKTMNELVLAGIEDKDIKTTSYNVSPWYKWNELTRVNSIAGYEVRNTVEVTVRDIDGVGSLLDDVVKAGSNRITGIRFGLEDESKVYNQALSMAVENAKEKAYAMGEPFTITNLKPLVISESGNGPMPIYGMGSFDSKSISAESSTPINPGEMEIVANVTVQFGYTR